MWILPVSALAVGAKVVEHTVLVEVILEHELAWGVKKDVLQAALGHLGIQSSAEAWLFEALRVWLTCQLVSIVVDALIEEMSSDRLAHVERLIEWLAAWLEVVLVSINGGKLLVSQLSVLVLLHDLLRRMGHWASSPWILVLVWEEALSAL